MTYNTSSPTVKCEKCEEHLTDFEQYEKHMAHMHGLNTSEESVVDWTLITDEDIITKDGNKYRVGGESINWSPNFDKEARIFLEEKYQKGKIEMLSKKKISEAKKFVKALETDTNQHYDNLINKIEGKGEDSYKELFPNKEQKFPQNKMPTAKWFSHQRDEAGVTDVGIQDQGYFDDPNAVMGSQTKRFSKGKYHIDEPVAKEQFSTSFYGEYLGGLPPHAVNSDRLSTDDGVIAFLEHQGASKYYIDYVLQFPDAPSVRMWKNHWKDGFLDFGGSFGTALFEGRIEDAYFNADGTNKANLQRMGLSFSSESIANEGGFNIQSTTGSGDGGFASQRMDATAMVEYNNKLFKVVAHIDTSYDFQSYGRVDYFNGSTFETVSSLSHDQMTQGFKRNPSGGTTRIDNWQQIFDNQQFVNTFKQIIQDYEKYMPSTDLLSLTSIDPFGNVSVYESKANEDSIGSDIDFGKLLNETPYDEQQGRFRTARDEQSPLDNIYHSKSVADDIARGEQETYAQDFIGGYDGKALYDNYDDLDDSWFYDSTGVQTKKVWESIAKEDLESEKKEWINAREELLKGNREPLLELVDRSGGDVELMKEVSVADALEQVDMEIDNFENYYTEAFKSLTEESYRVD